MRRAWWAVLAASVLSLLAASSATAARLPDPAVYTVTPILRDGRLDGLDIDIRFTGDRDGVTVVRLPERWSGAENLHRVVSDLRVSGGRLTAPSPAVLRIAHAPGAAIALTYRVRQDFDGPPAAGPERPFRPVTQPDWFTAVGWTVFAQIDEAERRPARFAWGALPDGWTVASDLDHAGGAAMPAMVLMDSVLTGGRHMRLVEQPVAGGRLRLAVHGDWSFRPEQLTQILSRVGEEASRFWSDRGEQFFVALTPLTGTTAKVQYGVGLGDAFSLWVTPNMEADGLRHILAHEHEHTWFPERLGGVRSGPEEPLDYWFSEGFTEFYTLRMLQRAGVATPTDYVTELNRILRRYAASPDRDAPNATIAAAFWRDPQVADLPYQRGLLLALVWDARMRQATGGARGLDDVVLAMKDGRGPGPQRLRAAYRALGGGDLGADFDRFVEGGARVMLPADLFGSCATVETVREPMFERGFDIAATSASNGVVDGVDPAGPAYAAGLRNGMRIIERAGGDPTNANVEMVYRVRAGDAERTIRYRPAGRDTLTVQQVVLNADNPRVAADCRAVMAGGGDPA